MINIPIKCSIAIIAHNHAMIPPYHANPGRMAFLERTGGSAEWRAALTASHLPFFTFLGFSDLTPGGKVGDRSDLAGNNISSSVANADNGIRMICHRLQHEGGHPVARLRFVFAAVLCLSASVSQATAQDIESLAKQSQNPIANLISLPFQNNTNFNVGRLDNDQNILNIQPIIPFKLTDD
jgi:hypothetical protein